MKRQRVESKSNLDAPSRAKRHAKGEIAAPLGGIKHEFKTVLVSQTTKRDADVSQVFFLDFVSTTASKDVTCLIFYTRFAKVIIQQVSVELLRNGQLDYCHWSRLPTIIDKILV